jgi:hypothetical protein
MAQLTVSGVNKTPDPFGRAPDLTRADQIPLAARLIEFLRAGKRASPGSTSLSNLTIHYGLQVEELRKSFCCALDALVPVSGGGYKAAFR